MHDTIIKVQRCKEKKVKLYLCLQCYHMEYYIQYNLILVQYMNSISCVTTYSHLVALTVVLISKERSARVSTGRVTGI